MVYLTKPTGHFPRLHASVRTSLHHKLTFFLFLPASPGPILPVWDMENAGSLATLLAEMLLPQALISPKAALI
jgi:hypothetical protein